MTEGVSLRVFEETCQTEEAWVEPLCGDKPDMEVLTQDFRGNSLKSKVEVGPVSSSDITLLRVFK